MAGIHLRSIISGNFPTQSHPFKGFREVQVCQGPACGLEQREERLLHSVVAVFFLHLLVQKPKHLICCNRVFAPLRIASIWFLSYLNAINNKGSYNVKDNKINHKINVMTHLLQSKLTSVMNKVIIQLY